MRLLSLSLSFSFFPYFHIYTHHIFSFLAFDTLELESSLVLSISFFFLRSGLDVRQGEEEEGEEEKKTSRNEHCVDDGSREKKDFFPVYHCYKKRMLMS